MSLWLALLWFGCGVVGFAVFVVCRKRVADIARQVGEEIEHRIRRVLDAERAAEEQLRRAFLEFQNPAEAIHRFQKARAEIESSPRANPPWAWTHTDLEFARKQAVAEETAHRCRSPVVAAIIIILALTIATATATVILSNTLQSAIVPSNAAGPMAGIPGGWASPNLPTLPVATPPAPPDTPAATPPPSTTATTSGGP